MHMMCCYEKHSSNYYRVEQQFLVTYVHSNMLAVSYFAGNQQATHTVEDVKDLYNLC